MTTYIHIAPTTLEVNAMVAVTVALGAHAPEDTFISCTAADVSAVISVTGSVQLNILETSVFAQPVYDVLAALIGITNCVVDVWADTAGVVLASESLTGQMAALNALEGDNEPEESNAEQQQEAVKRTNLRARRRSRMS